MGKNNSKKSPKNQSYAKTLKKRLSGIAKFANSKKGSAGLKALAKNPVVNYLRGATREIKRVTWPSRKETLKLTSGVVVYSLFFAAFITVIDYGLDILFEKIILGD